MKRTALTMAAIAAIAVATVVFIYAGAGLSSGELTGGMP